MEESGYPKMRARVKNAQICKNTSDETPLLMLYPYSRHQYSRPSERESVCIYYVCIHMYVYV